MTGNAGKFVLGRSITPADWGELAPRVTTILESRT